MAEPADERHSVREAKDEGILISVFTDRLTLPSEPAGAHEDSHPSGTALTHRY